MVRIVCMLDAAEPNRLIAPPNAARFAEMDTSALSTISMAELAFDPVVPVRTTSENVEKVAVDPPSVGVETPPTDSVI